MDANPPMAETDVQQGPSLEQERMLEQLEHFFTYHAPSEVEKHQYDLINKAALAFAKTVYMNCPPCADRTVAIRKIRESRMTANAAIACKGMNPPR
jgi:hypothetical protein